MAKTGPKPMDRTNALTQIFAAVAGGISLDRFLTESRDTPGIPSKTQFWLWHMENEEIRDNLARARENGVERLMDECVDIADTTHEGVEVEEDADGEITKTKRGDMLGHRKLRIDTRLKYAQMIAPRKYSPMQKHADADGNKIDLAGMIAARRARIADDG